MRFGWIGLLLVAALPAAVWAEDLDERIPVEPGGLLEIDMDYGEGLRPDPGFLEIASHAAREVRIVADASGWGTAGVRFQVVNDGRTVRLLGRVGGAFTWLFGGPQVQLRVWIPRDFSLDVRTTAGPIRIEDVGGTVRVSTEDAPIEIVGVEGTVKVRTAEGDVRISEVRGAVDVKSAFGGINLAWITGAVEARTGGGEIEATHIDGPLTLRSARGKIQVEEVDGTVEAKTERGSVFVRFAGRPAGVLETRRGTVLVILPRDARVSLDAVARDGVVEIDDAIHVSGTHRVDRVAGRINGGGPALQLFSARGDVRVRRY